MAARPNQGGNVYHRETPDDIFAAWNAVIRRVNEERQNPPEDTDCEPLDEIEEVEEGHIWTKGDVEGVRSAIDEMCPFAWAEPLDYWHRRILDEIDEALSREYGGWGDEADECCEPACLPDCTNAVNENPVETYIGTFTAEGCRVIGGYEHCGWEYRFAATSKGGEAVSAVGDWSDLWLQYCALVDAVEDLEHDLEKLQAQLAGLEAVRDAECAKPPPNNCAAAQQAVNAKQQEIEAKEQEIEEKESERDEKKDEADAKLAEADALAAESMALAQEVRVEGEGQYFYGDPVGSQPCVDRECDQLGPECLGKNPTRCCVTWSVQDKWTYYFGWGGSYEGNWNVRMAGGYTPTGQPYVTYIYSCAYVPTHACASTTCEYECHGDYQVIEVRMLQNFPLTTPEGETCCE